MKTLPLLSPALVIAANLTLGLLHEACGSVSYSTLGSAYLQDFDSLPNAPENTSLEALASPMQWMDDTTPAAGIISIPGWYLWHPKVPASENGFNDHQRLRIGPGSQNTGAFWSFGSTGSSERALGDVGSTTIADNPGSGPVDIYIGLRLRNDTGVTLERFTLSYNGEQWRDGGTSTTGSPPQPMDFAWSATATAITDAGFTTEASLGYVSPVFGGLTGVAVDGNVAGRVNGITATVGGFAWAPGTDLWLRWDDVQNPGNDHGLAIDDVVFSATIPEPSPFGLLALGVTALLARRRR